MKKYKYIVKLRVDNSYQYHKFDDYDDFQNWLGYNVHSTNMVDICIFTEEVTDEH